MERNIELICQLLAAINNHPRSFAIVKTKEERIAINRALGSKDDDYHDGHWLDAPEGYTGEQIEYHLTLMEDAGLIVPAEGPPFGMGQLHRLSFDGHEFLSEIRQAEVWENVKTYFGGKLAEGSWSVVRAVVTHFAVNLGTRGLIG